MRGEDTVHGAIGLLGGLIVGMLFMWSLSIKQETVIEHGCGEYNSITGEFQWIKATNDKKN